jgi:hypothetical protein
MRRSNSIFLAVTLALAVVVGTAPGLLARQDQELDPEDLDYEGIHVFCGFTDEGARRSCEEVEGFQTYDVLFDRGAYIPEQTTEHALVVKVEAGSLAFRTRTHDVIIDSQGNPIELYTADPSYGFGTPPNTLTPEPGYTPVPPPDDVLSDSQCFRTPPEQKLCRLDPGVFANGDQFVRLDVGDIVYLPAGSDCFLCNTTDIGDGVEEFEDQGNGKVAVKVQVWAPGSDFAWYKGSLKFNSSETQGTPTTQGSGRIVGWMFNPGSRCH